MSVTLIISLSHMLIPAFPLSCLSLNMCFVLHFLCCILFLVILVPPSPSCLLVTLFATVIFTPGPAPKKVPFFVWTDHTSGTYVVERLPWPQIRNIGQLTGGNAPTCLQRPQIRKLCTGSSQEAGWSSCLVLGLLPMVSRTHLSVVPSLPQSRACYYWNKNGFRSFFLFHVGPGKILFVRKSPSTFSCTDFLCNDFDALVVLLGP